MNKNEIIIAFTTQTSQFWPRLLCKHFKHCCVILRTGRGRNTRYQVVQIAADGIRLIQIDTKSLGRMRQGGWVLVNTPVRRARRFSPQMLACVGFAKRAAGLSHPWLWTPDQLYRHLCPARQADRAEVHRSSSAPGGARPT
jgi:hypothetical protein